MGRFLTVDEFQKVFRESEEYGHVRTLGIDHRPSCESIVHLEDQGVAVNEKKLTVQGFHGSDDVYSDTKAEEGD